MSAGNLFVVYMGAGVRRRGRRIRWRPRQRLGVIRAADMREARRAVWRGRPLAEVYYGPGHPLREEVST